MHRVAVTSGRDVSKARIENVNLLDVVAYLSSNFSAGSAPQKSHPKRSPQTAPKNGPKKHDHRGGHTSADADGIHPLQDDVLRYYKCVGVVELVAMVVSTLVPLGGSTTPIASVGLGWAPIPLFQAADAAGARADAHDSDDVSNRTRDGHHPRGNTSVSDSKRSVRLLRGSPRLLLSMQNIRTVDILHPVGARHAVSAMVLSYTLAPCPRLRAFAKLLHPHTLVGRGDVVPGLWNTKVGVACWPRKRPGTV